MRTKKIILIVFLFMAFANVKAQKKVRESNVYSLGLTTGFAEEGIASMINWIWHRNTKTHLQISTFWNIAQEEIKEYKIPYEEYSAQISYHRRIWSINQNNTMNLFVGGGVLGGYERINKNRREFPSGAILQIQSKILWGVFIEAHSEIYLGADIYATCQYTTYYHLNSDLGDFLSYFGVGFRYYLL